MEELKTQRASCKTRYCDFVGERVCCHVCPRRGKKCHRPCKESPFTCGKFIAVVKKNGA